jgi:hypothetical protein
MPLLLPPPTTAAANESHYAPAGLYRQGHCATRERSRAARDA